MPKHVTYYYEQLSITNSHTLYSTLKEKHIYYGVHIMKTLKNIIASSILAAMTLTVSAQADELMDIIHPESADLFHFDDSIKSSESTGVFNLNEQNGSDANIVWSHEYEEYVNKSDFIADDRVYNAQLANRYMENNPTAAGKISNPVFKWDPTYDGYMLQ